MECTLVCPTNGPSFPGAISHTWRKVTAFTLAQPVVASHTRTVPSQLDDTMRVPSSLYDAEDVLVAAKKKREQREAAASSAAKDATTMSSGLLLLKSLKGVDGGRLPGWMSGHPFLGVRTPSSRCDARRVFALQQNYTSRMLAMIPSAVFPISSKSRSTAVLPRPPPRAGVVPRGDLERPRARVLCILRAVLLGVW